MYETIDSSGNPVIIYENCEFNQVKLKEIDNIINTSGPIYDSKNSHKRTNKKKNKRKR